MLLRKYFVVFLLFPSLTNHSKEAKGLLIAYKRKDPKGRPTYSHLLEVLLRMRQCCNHWRMCGEERISSLLAHLATEQKLELTDENKQKLQDLLQLAIEAQEECPVCYEVLHEPKITACGHPFGRSCIERVIETQHKCPMCRAPLASAEDLVDPRPETSAATSDSAETRSDIDTESSSTKIKALIDILQASQKKDATTKTIVFSQWTSCLDIIQRQLLANRITFCRLDGSMKALDRDTSIDAINSPNGPSIMLASLAVCSVGLNLSKANQVVLMDSWWAPAIEDQAVDRVHRLGQMREVTVFRLVMKESIEERVLGIQEEKRKLMTQAFGEVRKGKLAKTGADRREASVRDIQALLR